MKIEEYIKSYYRKNSEKEHAIQVFKFSTKIFDEIVKIDKFSHLKNYKKCLEAASMLHDIGVYFEEGKKHAKIGAKMVREKGIEGFNEKETAIISCLIRYHRGKKPKNKHKIYGSMKNDEKRIVKGASAILQIADLLDYEHLGYVESITILCVPQNSTLKISTTPNISRLKGFSEAEKRKKNLFEKFFSLKLEIV